jgi:hypothetical protein
MILQLDLFHEMTSVEALEERMRMLEKTNDKMRKSLYAKHGVLCKQYLELHNRFEVLERIICKGKYDGLC